MGLLETAGKAITFGWPSKIERMYKKSALSDLDRLSDGEGGMSSSKRMGLQSEGLGHIQGTVEDAKREALRGARVGSGQAFNQQKALSKQKLGAQQQMMSSIRQQDLDEAERQRGEAYQKAAMAESMRSQRMNRLLEATKDADVSGTSEAAGIAKRAATAGVLKTF